MQSKGWHPSHPDSTSLTQRSWSAPLTDGAMHLCCIHTCTHLSEDVYGCLWTRRFGSGHGHFTGSSNNMSECKWEVRNGLHRSHSALLFLAAFLTECNWNLGFTLAKLQSASQSLCDGVRPHRGFVCWRREGTGPSIYAADAYTSVKHISWTVRHTFQMSSASNLFKVQLVHVSFECKIQLLLIKLDSVHHKQPHTSNRMGIHLYLTFFHH